MKPRALAIGVLAAGALLFSTLLSGQAQTGQEWPAEVDSAKGKIVIYEPQWETFQGDQLSGRAAISVSPPGEAVPVFGAMWFNATLWTDLDQRSYALQSIDVTQVKFPNSAPEQEQELSLLVETELPKYNLGGSLDTLLATLETAQKPELVSAELENSPPKIIYLKYPAALVLIDGEPKLEPIEGAGLMRVANTPMLMVLDQTSKKYYLSSGNAWYSAKDYNGPWQIDHNVPASVAMLVTDNGRPVKSAIPDAQMPRIIVSTVPAELIMSQGAPQYSPVKGAGILYMTNTENDVFIDINTQDYYALLSGRWYASRSLNGPWSFVDPDDLPADFAKIPADSAKGDVLVSVPGTDQAEEALTASQVPQTAQVRRSESRLDLQYDGDPQWEDAEGADIQYAVNTDTPVFLVSGRYYACDNAVWFVSAGPSGPWVVADVIPVVIYRIRPSCPFYYVRYVYIYHSDPEFVWFGYTPSYYCWYPYHGTVVFGTGYDYPGWWRHHYYPRCHTWGFHPRYGIQGWGFGYTWSQGFLTVGYSWNHDWHSRGWYGPEAYRPYRPPNVVIQRNVYIQRNVNIYKNVRIGNQVRVRDRNVRIEREHPVNIYKRPANVERVVERPAARPGVNAPRPARGIPNNVLADQQGNIYRRTQQGWQRNTGKTWSKASPAMPLKPPRETRTLQPVPGARPQEPVRLPPSSLRPTPSPKPEQTRPGGPKQQRPTAPTQAPPGEYRPAAPQPQPGPPPTEHRPVPAPRPLPEERKPQAAPSPRPAPTVPGHVQRDYGAREKGQRGGGPSVAPSKPAPRPQPGGQQRAGQPRPGGQQQPGAQPRGGGQKKQR